MPVKAEREYRQAQPFVTTDESLIVEGYASTFEPYVLYEYDGEKVWEKIDRHAFDEADMGDVILQYDHEGKVYARRSNGTLQLSVDDKGLKVRADLSKTAGAKELYEEISAGMITKMSFAFTVNEDAYDRETKTRTVLKVKKVYDVSAVSIPANPDTEISARDYFNGVKEAEAQEMREKAETEKRKRKIKLLIEVSK